MSVFYKLLKTFFFLVLLSQIIFFLGLPSQVKALQTSSVASNFSADYTVDNLNQAEVSIDIELNNVGDYPTVLTTYSLNLGYVHPENVRAFYGDEELKVELAEKGGMNLKIILGEVLLRVDETCEVNIKYDIKDFFRRVGGAYEVVLPVFEISSKTSAKYIKLKYDKSFGKGIYSNTDYSTSTEDRYYVVDFKKIDDVENIVYSIGENKFYGFNLEKKFVNERDVYVQKEVVFMPEFHGQKLLFSSVSPYPDNAYLDSSGNLILNFSIPPQDEIWVRLRGSVKRFLNKPDLITTKLSTEDRMHFLDTDKQWWKFKDDSIQADLEIIKEQKGVEKQVDHIYTYVMENLHLSSDFRNHHTSDYRKGAEIALKSYKSASAEDFADVFVGICRNIGIPARVVGGYVFPFSVTGDNLSMYHVWPQYWSEDKGWISVDPAYEKYSDYRYRKVGLRRVVNFIVEDEVENQSIVQDGSNVYLSNETQDLESKMDFSIDLPEQMVSGKNIEGTIKVSNRGNSILHWYGASAVCDNLEVNVGDVLDDSLILPGSHIDVPIKISNEKWYVSGENNIEIMVSAEGHEKTHRKEKTVQIEIVPLWWVEPVTWLITIITFIVVTLGLYWSYVIIHKGYTIILKEVFNKNV